MYSIFFICWLLVFNGVFCKYLNQHFFHKIKRLQLRRNWIDSHVVENRSVGDVIFPKCTVAEVANFCWERLICNQCGVVFEEAKNVPHCFVLSLFSDLELRIFIRHFSNTLLQFTKNENYIK